MDKIVATQILGGNPTNKRSETDFYPTPPDVTETLLRVLNLPSNTTIWEPACGDGDMVDVMRKAGHTVVATDLRYGQDFLTTKTPECDWIITNPPFSVSDKFIERCAETGKPFALLLKSQYWHAKKRYELFQKIKPFAVCPLLWRPNFLFKKTQNSSPLMDVMWVIWLPPYVGKTWYCPLGKSDREGIL